MRDGEVQERTRNREAGAKVLLAFFGLAVVGLVLMYIVAPQGATRDEWILTFALEGGLLAYLVHWYLWNTPSGQRLLQKLPPYRKAWVKSR